MGELCIGSLCQVSVGINNADLSAGIAGLALYDSTNAQANIVAGLGQALSIVYAT